MRLSIYAGPPLQRVLEGHDDNRSGRLNTVAERYAYIVSRDCPALPEAAWCAICEALMGDSGVGVHLAWAELDSADRLSGLGDKWDVDIAALVKMLRDGTAGQQVAVAEVVQRFWRHTDLPADEALLLAGARIS